MKFLVVFGLCVATLGPSVFSARLPYIPDDGDGQAEIPFHFPQQQTGQAAEPIKTQSSEHKEVSPSSSIINSAPKLKRSTDSNRHLHELNEDVELARRVARGVGGFQNLNGGGYPGVLPGAGYPGVLPGAGYSGVLPGGGYQGGLPGVGYQGAPAFGGSGSNSNSFSSSESQSGSGGFGGLGGAGAGSSSFSSSTSQSGSGIGGYGRR